MRSSVLVLAFLAGVAQPAVGWQASGAGAVNGKRAVTHPSKSPVMGPLRDAVLADGLYEETNFEFWDPFNFAGQVSDEALMWFRAAEIKHGRVSMLATLGYALSAAKITFPGKLATGLSFAEVDSEGPFSAWDKVPTNGKLQILGTILILELIGEAQKPHYMRGGPVGVIPPYAGLGGAATERQKKAEMKHGRIAMFGIISFLIGHSIPGSVPLLTGSTF
mmetsp:Transcript_41675/g.72232  ORF Transcript_41675/g.72232 Transcript_41675/m.72232 type:complete len:220 (-) Transcript_41675:85-744(-)